ncbi:MAG: hypothetical protein ACLGHO_05290 [Gammaproteobacteria bacterium]
MQVLSIRRPGQRGTRKLVALYGERLVCVRYRYDAASGTRCKTVELIVDQAPWTPLPSHPRALKPKIETDGIDDLEGTTPQHVGVKVFFREHALRDRVKAAGGLWSQAEKLWRLPYRTAVSLGLEHRIAKR